VQAKRSRLVEGGRIIVPAAFRRAMGVAKGDALILELHGEELRVRPARGALRRIQERLASLAPGPGEPLVSEELVAERRREAADG
jgi:bifunctional DNA-binding transcriptional regulator/antitoxin component of YhaV-PrlF toxin-antitoxin module